MATATNVQPMATSTATATATVTATAAPTPLELAQRVQGGAEEATSAMQQVTAQPVAATTMAQQPMAITQPQLGQMQVMCPPDGAPGMPIAVIANGQPMTVQIPPGTAPNQPFMIQLPPVRPLTLSWLCMRAKLQLGCARFRKWLTAYTCLRSK
jgi:hypothetical protein